MRYRTPFSSLAFIAAATTRILSASPGCAAPTPQGYTIAPLPAPGAGTDVRVCGLSHAGHVVGSAVVPTLRGNLRQAFVWPPDGSGGHLAATWLGGSVGPSDSSEALDVNDRGEVVGFVAPLSFPPVVEGVLWKSGSIGYIATRQVGGRLVAIDHDEELVQERPQGVAVLSWKSTRGASGSPAVLAGAVAHAVNDDGDVVGEIETGSGPWAYVTSNEKTTTYALLPGGSKARALGVNAYRAVCGSSPTVGGAAVWLPTYDVFRRTWTWTLRGLHRRGTKASEARGINDLGEVVGVWWRDSTTPLGFLHDSKTDRTVGFDELLPAGSGFEQIEPVAINNAGEIVGTARRAGALVAFVMRPARAYALTELSFEPTAINNRGTVVGRGLPGLGNPQAAFVYEGGQTTSVGGTYDVAWDVNDDGRYVGDFAGGPSPAAARSSAGTIWLVEPPRHSPSAGRGIANGHWASGFAATEGLVWSTQWARQGATVTPTHTIGGSFGPLAPDGFQGTRINTSRQVAGAAIRDLGGRWQHFSAVWCRRWGPEIVGISIDGGLLAAINDSGVAAGYDVDASGRRHALVFDRAAGRARWLPQLLNLTFASSDARGIDARGEIVGYSDAAEGRRACRWLGQTVEDLNASLSAADRADWTLTTAVDINDRGQVVGLGTRRGRSGLRGFLLTLP
ncbi:MAG: hypothetical protein R3F56_06505 [Planctomycetota bacterium]